jgi:hypothetical protein
LVVFALVAGLAFGERLAAFFVVFAAFLVAISVAPRFGHPVDSACFPLGALSG